MSKLHQARLKLRSELEAPPALRKFGSGWISGVLGLVLGLAAFALVLALRMPGTFSIPETHGLYENFAIHFPVLDRLFGTYHLPKEKWPERYGIGGHPVPLGYLKQFKYPFQREKASQ
jgi:hypothetical protein